MTFTATTHFRNFLIPHEGNGFRPYALRHRNLALYGIGAVVLKLVVTLIVTAVPLARVLPSGITPTKLVQLTNAARSQNGLKPLAVNRTLGTAADLKANDMLTNGYFAHISPSNVTPWFWFKRAGYTYKYAGENLAIDFASAESLVDAWLASPTHRKNLLSPKFTEIGIAVKDGAFRGSNTTLAVQFLGTPVTQPKSTIVKPAKPVVPTVAAPVVTNPPRVLGETAPSVTAAPPTPIFLTPETGDVVAGPTPYATGESQPGTTVRIAAGDRTLGTGTASHLGYFNIQLAELPDGSATVTAFATDPSTGRTSAASIALAFTVDSTPPSVNEAASIVLPSVQYGRYDVFVAVSDDATEIVATLGPRHVALTRVGGSVIGTVDARGLDETDVRITARDGSGNETVAPLMDLAFLEPSTLVVGAGPDLGTRVKLLFLSRGVVLGLLVFLVLALLLHILSEVRVRHHPTTASALLMIGFLAVLFLV